MIVWYIVQLLFWCGVIVLIVAAFAAAAFFPPYVLYLAVRRRLT